MSAARRDPDLVRAYVRTGGRTHASRDLDLITLVTAAKPPSPGAGADTRRVMALCFGSGPLSIAEISAHLDLPSSVTKIIAADLLDSEHLVIPAPAATRPDITLLKEVLDGLRALAI